MASPPQLPRKLRLVLLILGLCCTPVICQESQVSRLQWGIRVLIDSYYKYAEEEGNQKTMNCKELGHFLKAEMPNYLVGKGPDIVEKTLASLDQDKDGELSFNEFLKLQMQFMMAMYQAANNISG